MNNKRKSITKLARELRNNPTPSERKLWMILRRKQLLGYKFLRQKPIIYSQRNRKAFFIIADFYCAEKKLVIEVDGKYHDFQKEYDQKRSLVIKKLGLNILRIQNHELEDLKSVKEKIIRYLRQ